MVTYERTVLSNYDRFTNKPIIKDFLSNGGKLRLATDKINIGIINKLFQIGQKDFSEKYALELKNKYITLNNLEGIQFNFYGSIQTNKLNILLKNCDIIESLSNERHALAIKNKIEKSSHLPEFFIQVNTGKEPQKQGVYPENADSFIKFCNECQIPIKGLMCIPPKNVNPSPHFKFIRKLADKYYLEHCQMGFLKDFEIAIKSGATAIRIGSLIFGDKNVLR